MNDRDSDNQEKKRKLFRSRFSQAVLFYIMNEYELDISSLDNARQELAFQILKDMRRAGNNVPNIAHEIAYNIPL